MSRCSLFLLASALLGIVYSSSDEVDYENLSSWGPVCNNGLKQSPIDLGPEAREVTVKKPPIRFVNYYLKLILDNMWKANHTNEWPNGTPYVTGTLFNGEKYNFYKVHGHCGKGVRSGTEHSIWGRRFSSTFHLVHYNAKYSDLNEALNHDDGLLVLGMLLNVTDEKAPSFSNQLISCSDSSEEDSNEASLLKLDTLKSFYTYEGSLTTPPCTENVRWIIVNEVFPIQPNCYESLRRIELGHNPTPNVRPIQPLNDRVVELYNLRSRASQKQNLQLSKVLSYYLSLHD